MLSQTISSQAYFAAVCGNSLVVLLTSLHIFGSLCPPMLFPSLKIRISLPCCDPLVFPILGTKGLPAQRYPCRSFRSRERSRAGEQAVLQPF